jgi:hypothetical protein
MRTLIVSLLLVVLLITVSSAELLLTADPLGRGKWNFKITGMQDQALMNIDDATLLTYGGCIGYGLRDNLDVYLQLGAGSSSGLPYGVDYNATVYGLSFKCTLLNEGGSMPVSAAIGAGYRSLSDKFSSSGISQNGSGSQIGISAVVSKIMDPLVPYASLAYKQTNSSFSFNNSNYSQMDITVGTKIILSKQGAFLIEYTLQQITPKTAGVPCYNSNQIAAGVSFALRKVNS